MRRLRPMGFAAVLIALAAVATISLAAPEVKPDAAVDREVYPVIYSLEDLPVWRFEGNRPTFDTSAITLLIEKNVAPENWSTKQNPNGPGSMAAYEEHLGLVISQTSKIHEQIGELLEELRKNQPPVAAAKTGKAKR